MNHPFDKMMDRIFKELAESIARDIMAIGDGPTKCHRIQFKGGSYPDMEIDQGGLCEESLAREIRISLTKHWPFNHSNP